MRGFDPRMVCRFGMPVKNSSAIAISSNCGRCGPNSLIASPPV